MTELNGDLFDRVAADYDRAVPFFATFGERLVEWAGVRPGARVLDLGAGRGAVTAPAVRAGASVVAGDTSRGMLAALRDTVPGVDARLLDAMALDLPDASFDLVLSGFVLHVLPAPGRAFAEIARVLGPGGELVFSAPGPSTDGGWWASYGQVVDEFTQRLPPRPGGGSTGSLPECAERAGLREEGRWNTEVSFPVEGPEAHWSWLMSHGNRWLYDALPPADREEFRTRVLRSLREDHPTGGTRIIAGARFHRYTKPGTPA